MLKSLLTIAVLWLLIFSLLPLNFVPSDATIVLSGKSSGKFVVKNQLSASDMFSVDGLSLVVSKDYDVQTLIEKLSAKPTHYFSDGEVENYYYFTKKLPKSEVIAGKKVNLHVAVGKDYISLGSPIIYYGY